MKRQIPQHNREQSERLTELGMRLRDLRQQKDIPLEEIAGRTRIQPRLLRAIEQGKLEELPEAVYIHSFLRQYANALGLNGVQFASEFPTISGLPAFRSTRSWRSLPGAQLRPMHLFALHGVDCGCCKWAVVLDESLCSISSRNGGSANASTDSIGHAGASQPGTIEC